MDTSTSDLKNVRESDTVYGTPFLEGESSAVEPVNDPGKIAKLLLSLWIRSEKFQINTDWG
jgi:hypothetical protein